MLDHNFLERQCCGDCALEDELLLLFTTHAASLVEAMPLMTTDAQAEMAHRLRGSCLGIGAPAMARAARVVENADAGERAAAIAALALALADVEAAIRVHRAAR